MALTLVSILIAAIPVTYCFPTAFQELEEIGSKYYFIWAFMNSCDFYQCEFLLFRLSVYKCLIYVPLQKTEPLLSSWL